MRLKVVYEKATSNYAVYASEDMDFRTPGPKMRIWIPKHDIVTNIPGVFPDSIDIQIESGATAEEVERACREGQF